MVSTSRDIVHNVEGSADSDCSREVYYVLFVFCIQANSTGYLPPFTPICSHHGQKAGVSRSLSNRLHDASWKR